MHPIMCGIDLFAGAGGLSLGAELAGIRVKYAVEADKYAAETYRLNHPFSRVLNEDIKRITKKEFEGIEGKLILFGGPPCQGFSTSNQRTRNKDNNLNWLFQEFVRLAKDLNPEWIVFENVKGIMETEHGFFEGRIRESFEKLGYKCTIVKPCAIEYGVPQRRTRFFIWIKRWENSDYKADRIKNCNSKRSFRRLTASSQWSSGGCASLWEKSNLGICEDS